MSRDSGATPAGQVVAVVSEWLGPRQIGWRDASVAGRNIDQLPCHTLPTQPYIHPDDHDARPDHALSAGTGAVSRRRRTVAGNESASKAEVSTNQIRVTVEEGCPAVIGTVMAWRWFRRERMTSGLGDGCHFVRDPMPSERRVP